MKTIETNVRIMEDRMLHLPLPEVQAFQPGTYHVVVIIEEQPVQAEPKPSTDPLQFNMIAFEGWPPDATFRREDMYGDDGP